MSDFDIVPSALYPITEAAPKLGLSEYHLRDMAVQQRRMAFIRYTPKGRVLFRGKDLIEYLETCRQPASGERGRRAAQAAAAQSQPALK